MMSFLQTPSKFYQYYEVANAARKLLACYHGLIFRDIPDIVSDDHLPELRVDLRPSLPRRRVKLFLNALEELSHTMKLDMASRKYRLSFTKNYRSLMPADRRAYRLDVLEAAQDGHDALWVNGKKYTLKAEILQDKKKFRNSWFSLLDLFRKLQVDLDASPNQQHECSKCAGKFNEAPIPSFSDNPSNNCDLCQFCSTPWLEKLGLVLIQFDLVWCCFERNYINELIGIERQSKKLIMDCVYIDEELRHYEKLFTRIQSMMTPCHAMNTCIPVLDSQVDGNAYKKSCCQPNGQKTDSACQPPTSATEQNNVPVNCEEQGMSVTINAQKWKQDRQLIHDDLKKVYTQIRDTYKDLISTIATLNVSANARRKGRGDYSLDLFECAMCIRYRLISNSTGDIMTASDKDLILCQDSSSSISDWVNSLDLESLRGTEIIVYPLLEHLRNLRAYFHHISESPEQIDPHLCQNYDLVSHLAHLESAWDVAKPHIESRESILRLGSFLKFVSNMVELDHQITHRFEEGFNIMGSNNDEDQTSKLMMYNLSFEQTPPSKTENADQSKKRSPRESLEEMISTCDVAAFLAIPKLSILYYLINPLLHSMHAKLIQYLLPSIFEDITQNDSTAHRVKTPKYHIHPSLENPIQKIQRTFSSFSQSRYDGEKVSCISSTVDHQQPLINPIYDLNRNASQYQRNFFTTMRYLINTPDISFIPTALLRVVQEGMKVVTELDNSMKKSNKLYTETAPDFENALWQCLVDRCISSTEYFQFEFSKVLEQQIEAFCLAIEEASILLQRANPTEWNSFLQITMKCLEFVRRDDASTLQSRNQLIAAIWTAHNGQNTPEPPNNRESEFPTTPQSARLFQSSPITASGSFPH